MSDDSIKFTAKLKGGSDVVRLLNRYPETYRCKQGRGAGGQSIYMIPNLCEEDKQANEEALEQGFRLLSCYQVGGGKRIYIITEHDRSSTCLLLPEEYGSSRRSARGTG